MEPFVGFVECNEVLGKHVGEDVVHGFVHENCQLGRLGPELVGDLAPLGLRARVLLGEGGGDEGGDDAPALAAGIGPAGCGRSARGIFATWRRGRVAAALRPLWSSEINSFTPRSPRRASERRNSEKASASDAPIAMGSRRPWSLTATATVTATETMRPASRTFT